MVRYSYRTNKKERGKNKRVSTGGKGKYPCCITIRCSETQKDNYRDYCLQHGISLNELARNALDAVVVDDTDMWDALTKFALLRSNSNDIAAEMISALKMIVARENKK